MKTINIGAAALILIGILLLGYEVLASSSHTINFGRAGYASFVIGIVTLFLALATKRERAIITLFYSGLFLITLGSDITHSLFMLAFKSDRIGIAIGSRDSSVIFMPLGFACIFAAWILIVINKKQNEN
jgi:membrane-bound ClpP family serine protease